MASLLDEFQSSIFAVIFIFRRHSIIYAVLFVVGSSSSSSSTSGAKYFVQTGCTIAMRSLVFFILPLCFEYVSALSECSSKQMCCCRSVCAIAIEPVAKGYGTVSLTTASGLMSAYGAAGPAATGGATAIPLLPHLPLESYHLTISEAESSSFQVELPAKSDGWFWP